MPSAIASPVRAVFRRAALAAALVFTVAVSLLAPPAARAQTDDACAYGYSPDTSVWFGPDADSGVPNRDTGDGCTVLDVLWDEVATDRHGRFVADVARATRELRSGGALSSVERARVISAAARSAVGQPIDGDAADAVSLDQIGLVGYTVRNQMSADPEATLAALAACGYRNLEPSGSVGNFYGLDAGELAPLVDAAGIAVPSIGVSLGNLQNDLDGVIAEAHAVGAEYVRISGSSSWDAERYSEVAAILNDIGAQLAPEGITVAYHNHGWELEELPEGVRGYDILVRETDPELVAMELDVYWAASVGVDSVDLFTQYPGRFPLLHLKDIAPDGSFADVGAGTIDFGRLLAAADLAGVEYAFTEHDQATPDGVTSACRSLAFLRDLLS